MKKNLLTFLLSSLSIFGVYAEIGNIDFSYAEGTPFLYGKGKKENIDVAIRINKPEFAGLKIAGIKAYIANTDGLSETSVWLSKELTIKNKVNVPDIVSYDVTPVPTQVGDDTLGLLYAQLEEPYTMGTEPVYVGYSFVVDEVETEEQKYPIILCEGENDEGLFVHMSKSVVKWIAYSPKAGGVAYIVVEFQGDFPSNSLDMVSYREVYGAVDEPFDIEFSVSNTGLSTINTISYSYTLDDTTQIFSNTIDLPVAITPALQTTTPLLLPIEPISALGAHKIELKVNEMNGMPNESENASILCDVNVIPFMPVHRPLVEEYTGLWCGFCPRGFVAMEKISEVYSGRAVSLCYHNQDGMAVTNNYPVAIDGFPSASVDRIGQIDPYYGATNDKDLGIFDYIDNRIATVALASIDVDATLENDIVNISSSVKFIQDLPNTNYQIGYVLVANGLYNISWTQENYYSGVGGYAGTPLEEITKWPSKVKGLTYNDVVINVSAMSGITGSLPSDIEIAKEYTNDYSINIKTNKLVQNKDNLVVAAFVIDKTTRRVVNANQTNVINKDATGVDSIESEASVVSTVYYDLTGRQVTNPSEGLYIKCEKLSDGSVKTSKVIF